MDAADELPLRKNRKFHGLNKNTWDCDVYLRGRPWADQRARWVFPFPLDAWGAGTQSAPLRTLRLMIYSISGTRDLANGHLNPYLCRCALWFRFNRRNSGKETHLLRFLHVGKCFCSFMNGEELLWGPKNYLFLEVESYWKWH